MEPQILVVLQTSEWMRVTGPFVSNGFAEAWLKEFGFEAFRDVHGIECWKRVFEVSAHDDGKVFARITSSVPLGEIQRTFLRILNNRHGGMR